MTELRAAIGQYAGTAALLDGRIASDRLSLAPTHINPISKAFAPMVREGRYDVSEMAIATFLMARAYNKPLVLLPVVLAERAQESALLCLRDGPVKGPADIATARIGMRAYSQTTGMWLRGALAEAHGIHADQQRWVTFEDAHVPEFRDPPWVTRAPAGKELLAMLKAGEIEAAIFGNDLPDDPALRTVVPDPDASGAAFRDRHGFIPVNHLVVMRREHAALAPELLRMLAASGASVRSRAVLRPAIALAVEYCVAQGMLPRALTEQQVWEGLPEGVA